MCCDITDNFIPLNEPFFGTYQLSWGERADDAALKWTFFKQYKVWDFIMYSLGLGLALVSLQWNIAQVLPGFASVTSQVS